MTDDLTIPEEPDVERMDDGPTDPANPPPPPQPCPVCGARNCLQHPPGLGDTGG